jgi:primase-polymerase (primpol)-like protein
MKISNIKFRCTGEEKAAIQKKAARAGTTLSDYCRRQAIDGEIREVPKLSSAQTQYLQAITTCYNNFTRISNYMKNKSPELTEEIRKFLGDFKRLFYLFFPQK